MFFLRSSQPREDPLREKPNLMLYLDPREPDYPCSDGEPIGETDLHREMMNDLIEALKRYYADQTQVYVSGNILLYFDSLAFLATNRAELKRIPTPFFFRPPSNQSL